MKKAQKIKFRRSNCHLEERGKLLFIIESTNEEALDDFCEYVTDYMGISRSLIGQDDIDSKADVQWYGEFICFDSSEYESFIAGYAEAKIKFSN